MPNAVRASSRVSARDRPGPRPRVATKGANTASDDWVMSVLYTSDGEHFENVRQMLAASEHLSVKHECRNAEHAVRLRGPADRRDLGSACVMALLASTVVLPKILGHIQHIGPPVDRRAGFGGQRVNAILRQKSVRVFMIGVDSEGWGGHGGDNNRRPHCRPCPAVIRIHGL